MLQGAITFSDLKKEKILSSTYCFLSFLRAVSDSKVTVAQSGTE